MNLEKKLEELSSYITHHGDLKETVSDKPVGWHIDHSFRVVQQVSERLTQTDPAKYSPPFFNLQRTIVMTTGFIPRGKAPAPKAVRSVVDTFDVEELKQQEQDALSWLSKIDGLDKNSYFEHPFFGHIGRDSVKRFLAIHTNHHIKIIKDIIG